MRRLTIARRTRPLLFAVGIVALLASSVGVARAVVAATADSTPSSNPPSISVSFPTDGGAYNANSWVKGCSPIGICGSASDKNGVSKVTVAILNTSTGKYWNGSAFASTTAVYNNASGTTAWRYALSLPPDASYVAYVRATDALGNTTAASSAVNVTFSIDTTAPPAPTLMDSPDPITTLLDAVFHLADVDGKVHFQCQLDGQATQSCEPQTTFAHLTIGDHCVRLYAVDGALNVSAALQVCWSIVTRSFTITGNPPGLNYPGYAQPIDLVITNPYFFDLTVTSVDVTIQDKTTTPSGAPNPSCVGTENFRLASPFQGPVDVPARSTKSLSQLGIPQSQWPRIEMIDLPRSQDGCKNANFTITYSGLGRKHL